MHPRSLVMVFTLILMITLRDRPSTHATLRARSTIMHKIVVLGAMTVQTLANRARIAWLRRKSVLMLIAMVRRMSSHTSFLWQADSHQRSTIKRLRSLYLLEGDLRSFSALQADRRTFLQYTRNNSTSYLNQDMYQQKSFQTPKT